MLNEDQGQKDRDGIPDLSADDVVNLISPPFNEGTADVAGARARLVDVFAWLERIRANSREAARQRRTDEFLAMARVR